MAFEHDQFARFASSPSPYGNSSVNSASVLPQKPPVLARPPRTMASMSAKRRRAMVVVGTKLALLSAWLLHELIVGFDESRCLQMASSISNSNHQQSPSNSLPKDAIDHSEVPLSEAKNGPPMPSSQQQKSGDKVPKRRRKVILRRRLIRKGATTAANGQIVTKGAVRRVVWRVVPLKQLPSSPSVPQSSTEQFVADDTFPVGNDEFGQKVRTKTGTVMMLPKEARRRMARRRIVGEAGKKPNTNPIGAGQASTTSSGSPKSQQLHHPPYSHLFHIPLTSSSHPSSVPHVPAQMVALLGTALCLVRTFFDCWALLQCFCCALFLLGVHLRKRLLTLFPIIVDVGSIMLAIIFGLSTLIFVLILLLLVQSTLPASALWTCALFALLTNAAVALYTGGTFCELSAHREMSGEKKEKRRTRKYIEEEKERGSCR